jgi:hypothetical protein
LSFLHEINTISFFVQMISPQSSAEWTLLRRTPSLPYGDDDASAFEDYGEVAGISVKRKAKHANNRVRFTTTQESFASFYSII